MLLFAFAECKSDWMKLMAQSGEREATKIAVVQAPVEKKGALLVENTTLELVTYYHKGILNRANECPFNGIYCSHVAYAKGDQDKQFACRSLSKDECVAKESTLLCSF